MAYTANTKVNWKTRLINAVEYLINFGSDNEASGGGLTFETVVITEAAAGIVDLGVGASGEKVRLHKLKITMRAQGTIQYHSDTDGAQAGESDLSGPMTLGAGGGIPEEWTKDPDGCIASVVDEHLTIESTLSGFDGYAIISKGPA